MIVFMHDHTNISSEYLRLNSLIKETRISLNAFHTFSPSEQNVKTGIYGINCNQLLAQMKEKLDSMNIYDDIFPETTKKVLDATIAQFSEYLNFVDSHSTIRYGDGNELMFKVQALPILLEQITNAVEFDYNNHRLELENRLLRVITFAQNQEKKSLSERAFRNNQKSNPEKVRQVRELLSLLTNKEIASLDIVSGNPATLLEKFESLNPHEINNRRLSYTGPLAQHFLRGSTNESRQAEGTPDKRFANTIMLTKREIDEGDGLLDIAHENFEKSQESNKTMLLQYMYSDPPNDSLVTPILFQLSHDVQSYQKLLDKIITAKTAKPDSAKLAQKYKNQLPYFKICHPRHFDLMRQIANKAKIHPSSLPSLTRREKRIQTLQKTLALYGGYLSPDDRTELYKASEHGVQATQKLLSSKLNPKLAEIQNKQRKIEQIMAHIQSSSTLDSVDATFQESLQQPHVEHSHLDELHKQIQSHTEEPEKDQSHLSSVSSSLNQNLLAFRLKNNYPDLGILMKNPNSFESNQLINQLSDDLLHNREVSQDSTDDALYRPFAINIQTSRAKEGSLVAPLKKLHQWFQRENSVQVMLFREPEGNQEYIKKLINLETNLKFAKLPGTQDVIRLVTDFKQETDLYTEYYQKEANQKSRHLTRFLASKYFPENTPGEILGPLATLWTNVEKNILKVRGNDDFKKEERFISLQSKFLSHAYLFLDPNIVPTDALSKRLNIKPEGAFSIKNKMQPILGPTETKLDAEISKALKQCKHRASEFLRSLNPPKDTKLLASAMQGVHIDSEDRMKRIVFLLGSSLIAREDKVAIVSKSYESPNALDQALQKFETEHSRAAGPLSQELQARKLIKKPSEPASEPAVPQPQKMLDDILKKHKITQIMQHIESSSTLYSADSTFKESLQKPHVEHSHLDELLKQIQAHTQNSVVARFNLSSRNSRDRNTMNVEKALKDITTLQKK